MERDTLPSISKAPSSVDGRGVSQSSHTAKVPFTRERSEMQAVERDGSETVLAHRSTRVRELPIMARQ